MEANRKFKDKAASIDKQLDEAIAAIDWNRRNQAETSLASFVETYLMGVLFEVPPSPKMREVMQSMWDSLSDSKPFQVMLPRGSGKSVVATSMLLYLIATGKRKFAVIVSQSARSAAMMMKDFYYILTNKDSAFV